MEVAKEITMKEVFAEQIAYYVNNFRLAQSKGEGFAIGSSDRFELAEYSLAVQESFGKIDLDQVGKKLDQMFAERPKIVGRVVSNELRDEQFYRLKTYLPNGTKFFVIATPCDAYGRVYSDQEIEKGAHLKLVYYNPLTGMSSGYDNVQFPFAKLFPKEVIDHCTVTVNHASLVPYGTKADYDNLKAQVIAAFKKLNALLGYEGS